MFEFIEVFDTREFLLIGCNLSVLCRFLTKRNLISFKIFPNNIKFDNMVAVKSIVLRKVMRGNQIQDLSTNIKGLNNINTHLQLYYAMGHCCHSQNHRVTLGSLLTPACQFMLFGKAVVFVEWLIVLEYFILQLIAWRTKIAQDIFALRGGRQVCEANRIMEPNN